MIMLSFGNSTSEDLKQLGEATFLEVFDGVPQAEIAKAEIENEMKIVDVLNEKTKSNLQNSIAELNKTMTEFSAASKSLNQLLAENKTKLSNTVSNIDKTTANFAVLSDSLSKANLGQTVKNLEKTLANVDKLMNDMEQGKGTMGKLMKDETLYNNFTKTSKELELLLQDLRLHPTRYINVSVFGKKNKPYEAPELNENNEQINNK